MFTLLEALEFTQTRYISSTLVMIYARTQLDTDQISGAVEGVHTVLGIYPEEHSTVLTIVGVPIPVTI